MSEWLKEPVLKTGVPATVPWVRIPPCPLSVVNHDANAAHVRIRRVAAYEHGRLHSTLAALHLASWRGGREAEGTGLLNRHTGKLVSRVRIPPSPLEGPPPPAPGLLLISVLPYMTTPVKPPRLRFAPSPTGYLHVGGARTALFNWLFVK